MSVRMARRNVSLSMRESRSADSRRPLLLMSSREITGLRPSFFGGGIRWWSGAPGPGGVFGDGYAVIADDVDVFVAAGEEEAGSDDGGEQQRGISFGDQGC